MSRRYAGRRYAGGLGPSRVRTRIPERQGSVFFYILLLRGYYEYCIPLTLLSPLKEADQDLMGDSTQWEGRLYTVNPKKEVLRQTGKRFSGLFI